MAQSTSATRHAVFCSNLAVGLSTSSAVILEVPIPPGVRKLGVQMKPTVRALTAFSVTGKFHDNGAYVTITEAVTATPPGPPGQMRSRSRQLES